MVKNILMRTISFVLGMVLALYLNDKLTERTPGSLGDMSVISRGAESYDEDTLTEWMSREKAKLLVKNNSRWYYPYGDSFFRYQECQFFLITSDTLYMGTGTFSNNTHYDKDSISFVGDHLPELSFYPVIEQDADKIIYRNDSMKQSINLSQYHERITKKSLERFLNHFIRDLPSEPEFFTPADNCLGGQLITE